VSCFYAVCFLKCRDSANALTPIIQT